MTARRLIHLVDDDAGVRSSVSALLQTWGYKVEAFASGEAYLDTALPEQADCLLLDMWLPGLDGQAVLAALRERGSRTPVIVITGHGDVTLAVRSLRLGARDFVEKPFDGDELVGRIEEAVGAGRGPDPAADPFETLTPRERDVLREVVAGHPNKVIAHRLGLSPKTVETHRSRVMTKSGANSLSHLVRIALKAGIDPDSEPG